MEVSKSSQPLDSRIDGDGNAIIIEPSPHSIYL